MDLNSKTWKCVCCLTNRIGIPVHSHDGLICIYCLCEMYYDGWDRRSKELTLEETQKIRLGEYEQNKIPKSTIR